MEGSAVTEAAECRRRVSSEGTATTTEGVTGGTNRDASPTWGSFPPLSDAGELVFTKMLAYERAQELCRVSKQWNDVFSPRVKKLAFCREVALTEQLCTRFPLVEEIDFGKASYHEAVRGVSSLFSPKPLLKHLKRITIPRGVWTSVMPVPEGVELVFQ